MAETVARRVRRVRLRAENAAAAQRGLLLLEDALHTAALPDSRGRLLVVRRLDVGPIDSRGGPNAVALAVEERLRAAALYAVAADEPEAAQAAAQAGAVTFRDPVAPCVTLALQLARGEAADAWYWPLAVAGWRPDISRAAGLRLVVLHAAALLPGAAGAQRVAAALARARLAHTLLAALEPGDGARLLQEQGVAPELFAGHGPLAERAGYTAPGAQPSAASGLPPAPVQAAAIPLPAHWRAALAGGATQVGTHDARLRWLALAAVAEAAPALLLAPAAAAQAAQRAVVALDAGQAAAGGTSPARHRHDTSVLSFSPKDRSTSPQPASFLPHAGPATGGAAGPGGLPTAGGGLFFVIPLLHALRFGTWLAQRPVLAAARLPERLLLMLAGHAGLPPEDSLAAWLAAAAQAAPAVEGVEDACRLWRAGLRGWLARRARLDLRALIARPALLAVTPTHVDVTFDLALADLRVRRLGLDVDPGWVAWLGRVLSFHYDDRVTG